MKRGGGNLRRDSDQQSSTEHAQVVFIDGTNLSLAKAELDILRSGRFTSNGEFDNKLGELGSKFNGPNVLPEHVLVCERNDCY